MYKIRKNDRNMFEVLEINTSSVIAVSSDYEECRKVYDEMKKEKGFEGWTPAFMLIDTKQKVAV